MTLDTFMLLQRGRVTKADGSELDKALRQVRFARPQLGESEDGWLPEPHRSAMRADAVQEGYRRLRLLYV